MSQFTSAQDDRIVQARAPLYDNRMDKESLRKELLDNWQQLLLIDHQGKNVPCCLEAATRVYVCSKMKLYPDKRCSKSRSQSNADRTKKSVSVVSWFRAYKIHLDVMPDTGMYLTNVPQKKMVRENYLEDCKAHPTLYTPCGRTCFYHTWNSCFPEVKCRKQMRFAKCTFCVDRRSEAQDVTRSALEKAESKDRLKHHLAWAVTRERGLFHSKIAQHVLDPNSCVCISLDGTDQFIDGFPHFWEKTKQDSKGKRFKFHTEIAVLHGQENPMVFLAHEDIAGDPNLILTILMRILKHQQVAYGGILPPIFYLQLDNCFRENKNTYVWAFCAWLIETKVFKQVFVSFLPTGHTHFQPDQFASRISTGVKFRDVLTVDAYIQLIMECSSPSAIVEMVDDVYDWKEMLNPAGDHTASKRATFPKESAKVHRSMGVGTKAMLTTERRWYMGETSMLHWRFREDFQGKVMVQTKFTCDDVDWSTPVYPWTGDDSGIVAEAMEFAPNNPRSATREAELREALPHCKRRLSEDQWQEVMSLLERVTTPRKTVCYSFQAHEALTLAPQPEEQENDDDEHEQTVCMRPTGAWSSQHQQNNARETRKKQGHASSPLVVGNFVLYVPNYTAETLPNQKHEAWLGKILSVQEDDIYLQCYHTGTKQNLTGRASAKYKVWTGANPTDWIKVTRVLETFTHLTDKLRIRKAVLRKTVANLALWKTNEANKANFARPVVGVGLDSAENPQE